MNNEDLAGDIILSLSVKEQYSNRSPSNEKTPKTVGEATSPRGSERPPPKSLMIQI